MPCSLPPELIETILQDRVLGRGDYQILRQVSRLFHDVTTPLLFEVIYFYYYKPALKTFFSIIRSPKLSAHVKTIIWDDRKITNDTVQYPEDIDALFAECTGAKDKTVSFGNPPHTVNVAPVTPQYTFDIKDIEQGSIPDVETLREAIRRLPNLFAIKLLGSGSYRNPHLTYSRWNPELHSLKLEQWQYTTANQYGPESIWNLGQHTYLPGMQRGFAVVIMALSLEAHNVQELEVFNSQIGGGLDHKVFVQPPVPKGFTKAFVHLRSLELDFAGNSAAFGAGFRGHIFASVFRALRKCSELQHLTIHGPLLFDSCQSSCSILAPVFERLLSLEMRDAFSLNLRGFGETNLMQDPEGRTFSNVLGRVLGFCTVLKNLDLRPLAKEQWYRQVNLVGVNDVGPSDDLTERPGNWSFILGDLNTWKDLEKVSLSFTVAHVDQFCDFLQRHYSTLQRIDLTLCEIYDDSIRNFPWEALQKRLDQIELKYDVSGYEFGCAEICRAADVNY